MWMSLTVPVPVGRLRQVLQVQPLRPRHADDVPVPPGDTAARDLSHLLGKCVLVVSFETFFSCLPSATSCGRQQPTALDELYGADLHSFGSFLRLMSERC